MTQLVLCRASKALASLSVRRSRKALASLLLPLTFLSSSLSLFLSLIHCQSAITVVCFREKSYARAIVLFFSLNPFSCSFLYDTTSALPR